MRFFCAFVVLVAAAAARHHTLRVVCDDISTIWIDGKHVKARGTGHWAQMATVKISPNTQLVAVQCRNTGGPYGLMAEIKDGAKVLSVSDGSWKCSNRPHGGWEKPGFKGRFPAAVYTRQQGSFNKQMGEWRTMSPNRKVLWTAGGGRDKSIFCRKELDGGRRAAAIKAAHATYTKYNGLYVAHFKKFQAYNTQYTTSSKAVVTLTGHYNAWVKKANEAAANANKVAAAHKTAVTNYNTASAACTKKLADLKKAVDAQAAKQKVYVDQNKSYLAKANGYKAQMAAAQKTQATHKAQRAAAEKSYKDALAKRTAALAAYKKLAQG